jgi:hypothetical protein
MSPERPADHAPEQVHSRITSFWVIVGSKSFALGVEDRRAGRSPQFDREPSCQHDPWDYERGRLFATIAPVNMPLRLGRRVNPAAIELYRRAVRRGYIPL